MYLYVYIYICETCTRWTCVLHIFANCVQTTYKSECELIVDFTLFRFGLARCSQAKNRALPMVSPSKVKPHICIHIYI